MEEDINNPTALKADTSNIDIKALNEKIHKDSAFVDLLSMEMRKVIIGQDLMVVDIGDEILVRKAVVDDKPWPVAPAGVKIGEN